MESEGVKPFFTKDEIIRLQDLEQCKNTKTVLSSSFATLISTGHDWSSERVLVDRPERNQCFQGVVSLLRDRNWHVHVPNKVASVEINLPSSTITFKRPNTSSV